ncbi:Pentatricopeptide repeat-containing protein [Hibiscus syriacus]|uniref:Pentatricopeptide repeat-containing protein n=1 Tax=Hibiscus syriacus TaxID=106335 RepID=A0A6A2Z4Y7_HIBSY|nr:Pentatricopeptide repeat-containing protein [Hibiscus syriacus]
MSIKIVTLLSGFEKAGKDESAMAIFEEMRTAGCKPNICTFNALIKMHGNRGKFTEMMKIFDEIKACNECWKLELPRTFLHIMLFWQHWHGEGFGSKPRKILAEMRDGRCKPNELTYCSLLHVYANGKQVDRMHALAEEIYSGIIESHAVLLKTLVLVNSKCDLLERKRGFLELRKKGFPPDITTLNVILSIYGRRQMVSKTNEILNFMNESGYSPSLTTYNSLIKGRMKEASRIFSEMCNYGLVPDVITYNTFVASYASDSMFEEAIGVVRYMIKHGCKPNQNTYNSIVDGYCKLNRRDETRTFINSLQKLDPHISKDEEIRLSERIVEKWS